jgi:hypothetical protein
MQSDTPAELGPQAADGRGPDSAGPRATPLELVSAAVAGDDLAGLAGAAVAALGSPVAAVQMREAREVGLEGSRRALMRALRAGPPADVAAFVSHGRWLGFELSAGAVALCARSARAPVSAELPELSMGLGADLGDGRLRALLPLTDVEIDAVANELVSRELEVALSGPRREPAALHDALREAELMLELGCTWPGPDQTYRLLVGVLLRDPLELEQLRADTISALAVYDERHDTDLRTTVDQFLRHHGSTTETAEAMDLHRHTVGYRLARVHEVSGLSPYESDGREGLSLGLKADRILAAGERLAKAG